MRKPVGPPVPIVSSRHPVGKPTPLELSPEDKFEQMRMNVPMPERYLVPGSIGQAGFMLGSLGGGGLMMPLALAILGGLLEDPKTLSSAASGAESEGFNAILTWLGGRLSSKTLELGARWLDKAGIFDRLHGRISNAVKGMFSEYPLPLSRNATELRSQLGGGQATIAVGQKLGAYRNQLVKQIGEYTPAVKPQLVPASPGVPFHYTAGAGPIGRPFIIRELDASGNEISRAVGVGEAIDTVRRQFEEARSLASGQQKNIGSAPRTLGVAHQNRRMIKDQLNQMIPGAGDKYEAITGDYAVAKLLEKVFPSAERTATIHGKQVGVVDQPKLLQKATTVEARLNKIREGVGTELIHGISPTGAAAIPEHWSRHHVFGIPIPIPHPYQPETSDLLRRPLGRITDPSYAPLLGQGEKTLMGDTDATP